MDESKHISNVLELYILAGRTTTPPKQLAQLANHPNTKIRRRIAENPFTPAKALRKLAYDENLETRMAVACNPASPDDVVDHLVQTDLMVRHGLAQEPKTPLHLLERLSTDENPWVSVEATRTLKIYGKSKPVTQLNDYRRDDNLRPAK